MYNPCEVAAGIVLYRNGIFTIGKNNTVYLLTNVHSQATLTINLSGHSSVSQVELAALLVSVR